MLANRRSDSIDIEVVGSTHSFPDLVELFDDGVASLHDGFLVGSSSGVQMMGGSKPSERQTASIVLRIVAFARCLQFHVKRYAMSCAAATPMWNASTVAFSGKRSVTNQFPRQTGRRVGEGEDRDAVQRPQPKGSHERIAQGGLIDHQLRHPQLVCRTAAPPIARQCLVSGEDDVPTSTRRQVADDRGFNVDRGHGQMISRRGSFNMSSRSGVPQRSK